MLLVPDWLARTLLMAQAPSMWRDSLSQGAQRRTPPLLLRRRLSCARSCLHPYVGTHVGAHVVPATCELQVIMCVCVKHGWLSI